MNFLELCNRTKVKCRVQGAPMTALTNQTGDYARIIAFVNEAWMAIQLAREDWNWMRATAQFPTVNAKPLYSIADIESTGSGLADFGNWDKTTFRLWITAVGQASEQFLWPIDYDDWRDRYQFSSFVGSRQCKTKSIIRKFDRDIYFSFCRRLFKKLFKSMIVITV